MQLIKWVGGKAKQVEALSACFEGCPRVYHEPFMGGGALFFHLAEQDRIDRAALSDANARLIGMWRMVRDCPHELIGELASLGVVDWEKRYTSIRDEFRALANQPQSLASAARFVWLNRACFNGLYRENSRGEFNVPVGRYAKLSLPGAADILRCSQLLARAELHVRGFSESLREVQPGDWVYCDPPYVPLSVTSSFVSYVADGFGSFEQKQLASDCWLAATTTGARVVVSNHDLPFCRNELYHPKFGWSVAGERKLKRTISAGQRGEVAELMVSIGGRSPFRGGVPCATTTTA